MRLSNVLLLIVTLLAPITGWCQDQRLKVEGTWDGKTFQVNRIKERDPTKDVRTIRVSGPVATISPANRMVQVGPVRMRWQAEQESIFSAIKIGDPVRVDAQQVGSDTFVVTRIESTQLDSSDSIELIGAVTGFRSDDEWTEIYLAGISAKTPKRLFSNGRLRLHRLDDRRPDNQFTTTIGGVATTIGGEFGLKTDADGNRNLDSEEEDEQLDVDAQVQLEAFFEFSDGFSGFAEIKADQLVRYDSSFERKRSEFVLRRGELWLFVDQPLGLPIGIQVGRQNLADDREWWWDTDLDAIRAYFSSTNFQVELAIAKELGRVVLNGEFEDAENLNVTRLIATSRFRVNSLLSIDIFLLRQNDDSSSFDITDIIRANQGDEDDSDLTWVGARLHGDAEMFGGIETNYWFDIAQVSGTETLYEFDDVNATELVVESVTRQDRSGTGFDLGATIVFSKAAIFGLSQPTFTFAYAGGSGDRDSDGTFRQTGLHDNNGKYNGVDRFRYYGELSRPDLENIRILTFSAGFRFGEESSIEFIFHNYRQDHISEAHPLRLDIDANGASNDIGNEFDLVMGIERWKHFEFEAVAAYFMPGSAFDASDPAWQVALKLDYNF